MSERKFCSIEEIRNELKTENKETFYLVDPIVDLVRDCLNNCDLTKLDEKTTIDIVRSETNEKSKFFDEKEKLLSEIESRKLDWIPDFLVEKSQTEKNERKFVREILRRSVDLIKLDVLSSWTELEEQIKREFARRPASLQRSIELLRHAEKSNFFLLQSPPSDDCRRNSFLITEKSRRNLKNHRELILRTIKNVFRDENQEQIEQIALKTFLVVEQQKPGEFDNFDHLKVELKKSFPNREEFLVEKVVDVFEQGHVAAQFEQIDRPAIFNLLKDRRDGKRSFEQNKTFFFCQQKRKRSFLPFF